MTDELLPYYNRELAFIRRMGAEFAKENPKIAGRLQLSPDSVEDPHVERVIEAALVVLNRDRSGFLEDLGTYLVSHPNREALRRLLRFCGTSFIEFLHALDDLPGRVHLAIPDLDFPALDLRQFGSTEFLLTCDWKTDAAAHVMLGVIRAMADDYGALAMLESEGSGGGCTVRITLLDHSFAEGREFALAGSAA